MVQNFLNMIGVVDLAPDLATGTVGEPITSDAFRVPTTAAVHGNGLYAVNARFDEGFPPIFGGPVLDLDYEVVRVTPSAECAEAFELHAGTIYQRRVLSLRCATAAEAEVLILSFRALLRCMSLGDRAFTMYALQLFKLADRDVLGAISRGASTNEIAAELYLSPHTVRDYVKTVFEKVGVKSRGELVARLFGEHYADRLHETMVDVH